MELEIYRARPMNRNTIKMRSPIRTIWSQHGRTYGAVADVEWCIPSHCICHPAYITFSCAQRVLAPTAHHLSLDVILDSEHRSPRSRAIFIPTPLYSRGFSHFTLIIIPANVGHARGRGFVRLLLFGLFIDLFWSDTCRICSTPGTDEQPLFHPCKCSGTIRYIHQDWYV